MCCTCKLWSSGCNLGGNGSLWCWGYLWAIHQKAFQSMQWLGPTTNRQIKVGSLAEALHFWLHSIANYNSSHFKISRILDHLTQSRCLKITEKVSFNRASEASFVYILSGRKINKKAKNGEFLKTWSLWPNSVTRQVSFNRTKIGGKCQNSKIQIRQDF